MLIFSFILLIFTEFVELSVIREDVTTVPPTTKAPVYGAYKPNSTICFDELVGCFSNFPPFNNTGNYLPVAPDVLKTEFLYFSRKNVEEEQWLSYTGLDSIRNSNFNKDLPLIIIIHGFSNNRSTPWIHKMKRALLLEEDLNIIVAAWGNGSTFPLYNNASSNIRLVGKQTGLLINAIKSVYYASAGSKFNIHCIGHSLGAHSCGYAANAASVTFKRITALDPAGPFFEETDPLVRVDPTDANFVDAIHSNGGTLLSASFGLMMPTGHVDFYVNGGSFQPGCPGLTSIIGSLLGGTGDPTTDVGCSHNKVIQYFIESISSHCAFIGFNCPTQALFDGGQCISCFDNKCSQMGYHANNFKGRGTMYLQTNGAFPYCGHHHMFEMDVSGISPKTAGDLLILVDGETNNSTKELFKGLDIKPNDKIKRIFVTEHDFIEIDSIVLNFNRKSKPLFGSEYPPKVNYNKIKVTNMEIGETFSICQENQELLDKQPVRINIYEDDCQV